METNYPTSGSETTGLHKDRDVGTKTGAGTGTQSGSMGTQGSNLGSKATRMRDDLSNLKSDLDALMSHASTLNENELSEARDRILARFSSMRYAAKGIAEQAGRQFNQGRDMTVDYVREKPLQSVAIAAGVGLLIGAMMRRS